MSQDAAVTAEIDAYVDRHNAKTLLRFITCGSVDDGKSTLIGRLLFESQMIFDDQLAALELDSKRVGTQGDDLDLALLLDGLVAEREQGITIDVAYRYFSTDRRTFIVADTPGHEQYTRNMVTGASTADCAVVLVDARKGMLTQSRRHMTIVSLLGIRHVVVAINKMDLVDRDEQRFVEIERDVREQAALVGLLDVTCIPLVALTGANVVSRDESMPWYGGPTLLEYLESVEIDEERMQAEPLRMSVQWVVRPDANFRGFAGTVVGGTIAPGDPIIVLPSGRQSRVGRIVTRAGDLDRAVAGQAVVVTLTDEIDVSRGDTIAHPQDPPEVADQFEATVVWMADVPLLPGRAYLMRAGTSTATATIGPLKYKLDVDTLGHMATTKLELNEIGEAHLALDRRITFDPYTANRDTGGFILIDRITFDTVAAGLLRYALRRSTNVQWQAVDVDKASRSASKGQKPAVIWLTGLSGAGKSTIGNLVDQRLHALGRHTYMLDGDNVRHGLCRDLGFTAVDRVENLRRVGEVARLMVDAGLIVIASFISPYRNERQSIRDLLEPGEFHEVFVDTPLEVAEQRDAKGLYAKARRGELLNFTGVDAPYEAPESPELHIDTTALTPEQAAAEVIDLLTGAGRLGI
jgi:bifunctional enzyme CysN/CysC